MKNPITSRKSGKLLLIFSVAISAMTIMCENVSFAQAKKTPGSHIKLALNAYSFNDVLLAKGTPEKPAFTLFDLLDWCAEQNIEGIDITGYYIPTYPEVPSDEYIYELKQKAFRLGIDITGTGIRNNFASPNPAVRAADVERAKKWIIVAEKLGAPVIRLFAGEIPKGYENKWDEVAAWMIECFKECAAFGEQHGVIVGIQNHGDMIRTADQCIEVVKAVNSKWAGIILDTGNFKVADPYTDIETVIPFTVNWQVKESVFGNTSEVKTDYRRLMRIIKKSGYRGYLPVETLKLVGKNKPYDPFVLVPQVMKELTAAKEEVYSR
ncbi:MAG TPA: sugar phosphate isomerase/epimerase family protein [Bacteroidales bacterium]|nr:sugar phosphate isomerase/epimerase family protein [Bacteroidales bacterium]